MDGNSNGKPKTEILTNFVFFILYLFFFFFFVMHNSFDATDYKRGELDEVS